MALLNSIKTVGYKGISASNNSISEFTGYLDLWKTPKLNYSVNKICSASSNHEGLLLKRSNTKKNEATTV